MKNDFGRVVVYTSGLQIGNKYKQKLYETSGCGVFFGDGISYAERNPAKYSIKWDREHAEAFAVEIALRHCRAYSIDHIEIRTTSKHLANAFNEKIEIWEKDAELRGNLEWRYRKDNGDLGIVVPYFRYSAIYSEI